MGNWTFPLWLQSRRWGANAAKSPDSTQDPSYCLFHLHGDGPLAVSAPSYIHDVPLQTSISVTQSASPCPSQTSSLLLPAPCVRESVSASESAVSSAPGTLAPLSTGGDRIADAPTLTRLLLGSYEFYPLCNSCEVWLRVCFVSGSVLQLGSFSEWVVYLLKQHDVMMCLFLD